MCDKEHLPKKQRGKKLRVHHQSQDEAAFGEVKIPRIYNQEIK